MDSVGENEVGMIWENIIEQCILSYMNRLPRSMNETGHSKPVHWVNTEGWDGEGDGRGVQDGGYIFPHDWFMSMHGKNPPQYCK